MIALLLLIAADDTAAALIARAGALTTGYGCTPSRDTTDITVCGLRNADRFRLPFVVHDPGDPRHEAVADERHRLLHRTTPVEDMGPFQVEGGMAGVSVGVDTATGSTQVRRPAP